MQRSRRLALIAVAVAVLALVGCGDSGPSMDDWREEAAAACKTRDDALKAIAPPLALVDMAGVATRVVETLDKARTAIVAIERPDDEEGRPAEDLTLAMASLNETMRPWTNVLRGEDFTAIETGVNTVMEKAKAADEKATAAGVPACATTAGLLDQPVRQATVSGVSTAFRGKLAAICTKLETEHATALDDLEGKAWIDRALLYLDTLATDLRAIPAPLTNRNLLDNYLTELDAFRQRVRTAPLDLRRTNEAAVEGGLMDLLTKLEAGASALGLTECGNGPT